MEALAIDIPMEALTTEAPATEALVTEALASYGGAGQKSAGLDSGAETTVEELAKSTMGEYS